MSPRFIQLHDLTVQVPRVPNFILLDSVNDTKISVGMLSDQALRQIGEAFTEDLIARAKEVRENKP